MAKIGPHIKTEMIRRLVRFQTQINNNMQSQNRLKYLSLLLDSVAQDLDRNTAPLDHFLAESKTEMFHKLERVAIHISNNVEQSQVTSSQSADNLHRWPQSVSKLPVNPHNMSSQKPQNDIVGTHNPHVSPSVAPDGQAHAPTQKTMQLPQHSNIPNPNGHLYGTVQPRIRDYENVTETNKNHPQNQHMRGNMMSHPSNVVTDINPQMGHQMQIRATKHIPVSAPQLHQSFNVQKKQSTITNDAPAQLSRTGSLRIQIPHDPSNIDPGRTAVATTHGNTQLLQISQTSNPQNTTQPIQHGFPNPQLTTCHTSVHNKQTHAQKQDVHLGENLGSLPSPPHYSSVAHTPTHAIDNSPPFLHSPKFLDQVQDHISGNTSYNNTADNSPPSLHEFHQFPEFRGNTCYNPTTNPTTNPGYHDVNMMPVTPGSVHRSPTKRTRPTTQPTRGRYDPYKAARNAHRPTTSPQIPRSSTTNGAVTQSNTDMWTRAANAFGNDRKVFFYSE
eukprot:134678_1